MICEKCGTENPDKAKFCRECGTEVKSSDSKDEVKYASFSKSDAPEWLINDLNKILKHKSNG